MITILLTAWKWWWANKRLFAPSFAAVMAGGGAVILILYIAKAHRDRKKEKFDDETRLCGVLLCEYMRSIRIRDRRTVFDRYELRNALEQLDKHHMIVATINHLKETNKIQLITAGHWRFTD